MNVETRDRLGEIIGALDAVILQIDALAADETADLLKRERRELTAINRAMQPQVAEVAGMLLAGSRRAPRRRRPKPPSLRSGLWSEV